MFAGIRIVTLVRFQLVVIAAVLAGLISTGLWSAVKDRQTASYIMQVETASELAIHLQALVERQDIGLVIAAASPRESRHAYIREADAMQEEADALLADLLEHMERHDLVSDSRFSGLVADLEAAMRTYSVQRTDLVADLVESRASHDSQRTRIEKVFAEPAAAASTLAIRLQNSMRELDPVVAQQIGVHQHAGMLWDIIAEQRKEIATRLASSGSLQGLEREELQATQERARSLWDRMNQLAAASVASEELTPALKEAEQKYLSGYHGTIDEIINYRVRDEDISFQEWRDIVVPAVDAITGLETATSRVMTDTVSNRLSAATWSLVINAVLAAISILVIVQMILFMQGRLIKPVRQLVDAIADISRGNLDREVILRDRKDEIGEIAAALDKLRKEGVKARRAEEERQKAQEERVRRGQQIESLTRSFNEAISGSLDHALEISRDVNSGAQSLHEAAERVRGQSEFVDEASEQATHNVQTVASASEELAASIHEINSQIEQSRILSEEAVQKSRETSAKVHSLSESAARIDTVRQLITDIAEKTNLLALNAAIEAARAGEAGKGFNIVASEVKDLAKQTADATNEIDRQIRAMEMDTREVVEGSETIESFISRVNEAITTIASAAEQQSAATQEISRSVQDAAAGNRQVNDGTAEVRKVAEEANEMAQRMLGLAEDLNSQSSRLKEEVSEFLEKVRKD